MTHTKIDLRDQLALRYGRNPLPQLQVEPPVATERAFVTHAQSGRTVITAPVREVAHANVGFTYLRGRFVEADHANDNGALWTTEDLQMGGPTVAGGPLNWLHNERVIIGSLLHGELVTGRQESALDGSTNLEQVGNHIVADAAVWRFLYPEHSATIEKAAADGALYYSMECVSREVACMEVPGRPGCGEIFSYRDYDAGKACAHLRERSSVRRLIDPVFLGGAVIVPPVQPGWKGAEATVLRQAAALTEENLLDSGSVTHPEALALATAVLQWANRD